MFLEVLLAPGWLFLEALSRVADQIPHNIRLVLFVHPAVGRQEDGGFCGGQVHLGISFVVLCQHVLRAHVTGRADLPMGFLLDWRL